MKPLLFKKTNSDFHWVGDGFYVRTIFSYHDLAPQVSPFLLMDYAAPKIFSPTQHKRGVGEHPHRGFETVTIVYSGEVEHRDSAGGGGIIGPGDVQWMSAASGLVHEEFHSPAFSRTGGSFEMVQLWVNLPAAFKMSPPRYQGIKAQKIPLINPASGVSLRIIAGSYQGHIGPAETFSPINLWDLKIEKSSGINLDVPSDHTCALFVLEGQITTACQNTVSAGEIAVFDPASDKLSFSSTESSKLLFLGGAPLNEPIVGYGPFVMNTQEEIRQAFFDYQSGKMGQLGKIRDIST